MNKEKLEEDIKYWESYQPVNNMGKWYVQVRLDNLREKLNKLNEKKVLPNKGR